jgi:hypothetical protein
MAGLREDVQRGVREGGGALRGCRRLVWRKREIEGCGAIPHRDEMIIASDGKVSRAMARDGCLGSDAFLWKVAMVTRQARSERGQSYVSACVHL